MSIPAKLLYRQVYFYVEAKVSAPLGDYFLSGAVNLQYNGTPSSILPASIGSNGNNLMLNKSIPSCFTAQVLDRQADGVPRIGSSGPFVNVLFSNSFSSSAYNLMQLGGRALTAFANELVYVIQDWSRPPGADHQEVTGYRCFAMVISSSAPIA